MIQTTKKIVAVLAVCVIAVSAMSHSPAWTGFIAGMSIAAIILILEPFGKDNIP